MTELGSNAQEPQKKIKEIHTVDRCLGRSGVVPKGKEPGRNVKAVVYKDISREVDCDNFTPEDNSCALDQQRCVWTRTPTPQLTDHTLSHIENDPRASRTSLQKILDRTGLQVMRIVDPLLEQGIITEAEKMPTQGRAQIRLKLVRGNIPPKPNK